MWISLILLALFFAIALTQAMQGLFSAFLTVVLALCCAALAFGTYEWVAIHWLAPLWKPDYAYPIALGVVFGAPLIGLRLAADQLIRRACLLPGWVDRVGGGLCGVMTALIMVGIFGLCIQMIPFGGSIIGFQPVAMTPQQRDRSSSSQPPGPDAKERKLMFGLGPDRFAAVVASVLSDGIFSGDKLFYKHNPDLSQAVAWNGAVHAEVSRYAPPKSISIEHTEPVEFVYRLTPPESDGQPPTYDPEGPMGGNQFRAVRIKLKRDFRDISKNFNFTLRQIRLVGQQKGAEEYEQYYPVAIRDLTEPTRHIRYKMDSRGKKWAVVDEWYRPASDDKVVDVVFELPTTFQPSFLEFKRAARAAISFDKPTSADARRPRPSPDASASRSTQPRDSGAAPPPSSRRRRRRNDDNAEERGRVRGVAARGEASHFGDELPMTLTSYRGVNTELGRGGVLKNGKLVGEVVRQANGPDPPVRKFEVPEDMRLLQLSSVRLRARSTLGRALSQAVTTVQNYFVEDSSGNRYSLVGKYAIAEVRGVKYIEVQYFSGPTGSMGGLGAFGEIREGDLKPDDEFALLFLVKPGARIVAFSSGGSSSRRDDLTEENLTAPP